MDGKDERRQKISCKLPSDDDDDDANGGGGGDAKKAKSLLSYSSVASTDTLPVAAKQMEAAEELGEKLAKELQKEGGATEILTEAKKANAVV